MAEKTEKDTVSAKPASAQPGPSGAVTISPSVLFEDLGTEAVLLNLDNEQYYGFDDIAMQFWSWLEELGDLDAVHRRAVETFDIDPATLKHDIGVFVVELIDAGLLSFVDGDS